MKACPKKDCRSYGKRFETLNFCTECGSGMAKIKECCAEEGLTDMGFCGHCGKEKKLIFVEGVELEARPAEGGAS